MLTFFDYLRQRAFESVLAGAQEALELLENQKRHNEYQSSISKPSSRVLDFQQCTPTKQEEETAPNRIASTEDDELLPAPRRRTRPDQQPKGNE